MLYWLTQTVPGKIFSTFIISMMPVVELRGGLPFGITQGLDYPVALVAAVLGNMLPVPFVIVYIRRIFAWLREKSKWLNALVCKMEEKAHIHGRVVQKYSLLGLYILVAIPLPGTGAWTGALVAAFLDIRLKRAVPFIFLGVCTAACIMTLITFGVGSALS